MHKVRLLDRSGFKIRIVQVETNILAGRAILVSGGRWFVFSSIAGDALADFNFIEVEPPHYIDGTGK